MKLILTAPNDIKAAATLLGAYLNYKGVYIGDAGNDFELEYDDHVYTLTPYAFAGEELEPHIERISKVLTEEGYNLSFGAELTKKQRGKFATWNRKGMKVRITP